MSTARDAAAARIMVAMDYSNASGARVLLDALEGIPCYLKVGLQLFFAEGPSFVEELKKRGYKIFLDVKMHDIPNTVKGGAESVTRLGVDMFNIHAAGGRLMMEQAMEGVDKALTGLPGREHPLVIGVTQLTSTSLPVMNDEIGIPGSVEDSVVRYALLAKESGLHGVVASPHEVERIKEAAGASFVTVTPGIRPAGSDIGDQARVMTPKDAFAAGTDYIVIGRPITAAADPRLALETILEELI